MAWTDERVELLRGLWLNGMSASCCAVELGGGITRNAVIGKVHRLGLTGRPRAANDGAIRAAKARANEARRARRARRRERAEYRIRKVASRLQKVVAASPALLEPTPAATECIAVVVTADSVTLLQLQAGMCRFPLGDPRSPDFRFCGARAAAGTYCDGHRLIARRAA